MITTTDHGPVRELRFARPPVNALSTEFIAILRLAIEQAPLEGSRALVVSGSPGMYSAGLDLPLLIKLDRSGMELLWRELYALMRCLATSPIPVCAAITGHAPAGGTVIALFCDYRIAAQGDFKLGLTEVQAGIPLPPVILQALRRQIGPRQAERLAVPGLMLSPEQSLSAGLVDELVAPDAVVDRSVACCQSLLALPSEAMLSTRLRARADLVALFEKASDEELQGVLDSWFSAGTQGVLQSIVARLGKKSA
jgi:enoyl-CoA hydratase/carnithine racemase